MKANKILEQAVETHKKKNKEYGESYHIHGLILTILFPNGCPLHSDKDHNRFALLTLIIVKIIRYCINFFKGGHQDSIHDIIVYASMLEEIDDYNST